MTTKNNYHELNYQDNLHHYQDFTVGGKSEAMARTWLETGTVDAWRHRRMYRVLDPLLESESSSWLTIGDGRYGKDARYISEKGGDVTASDIDDSLLKEAINLGFISKFSKENAESLSFGDEAFEYVLCKESYHHFPRPMIALYEMLRVASKGVVLIEPNDQYIGYSLCRNIFVHLVNRLLSLVHRGTCLHSFEAFGNYIYTISRRELEKTALGLNYKYIAFKGVNDSYAQGVEFEEVSKKGKLFKIIKMQIFVFDLMTRLRLIDYGILVAILFKQSPSETLQKSLLNDGFEVVKLPENHHSHGREK